MIKGEWKIPAYKLTEYKPKANKYCVCIPVINEGTKIQKQLAKLKGLSNVIDIIILDGGSTDGSLADSFLIEMNVRALLTKQDKGKLSAQLRIGFSYAINEQYSGVITVDGNNKDSVEDIPEFIKKLEDGYDFVQGSRYVPGGTEVNTPVSRKLAIKLIHAPFISLISGFHYTDTTNGFRAHSLDYLLDHKVQPFRDIFETYELLGYLSVQAPKLGYKVIEIPVSREYPIGKIPTKISPIKGNWLLIKTLLNLFLKKYDVKHQNRNDLLKEEA
ncbi:glycosyltransferase family 2 protein [Paenibacillus sp. FSL R7-0337]|uniref:glycosyltransferase family 2 protein n=1 Tax=Paenibacillus sp. FSL R7-0337 TaxID=1926588 RepID=UPI00096C3A29|nr:glycosyltransferase family 2 protein [Paenibacillus sp. FSL R7-0337]OMF88080.1 glycosyl transferase family 2 [Paenibacillus sp. FSL R7-0337]